MTIFRFNPANPIPNEPFYYPQSEALNSASGPLIVGSGINIDYATGVISAPGGSGGIASITVVSPVVNTGTATDLTLGVQVANTLQLGAVQIGPNIQVASGTISVLSASTTQAGVVRLNDSTNSSSNLEALTANQGRNLQDQIDAIVISGSLVLSGTFNSATSQVVATTSVGAAAGFAIGSNLPAPAPAIENYYVVVITGGTYTPPGSSTAYDSNPGDWFVCDGTAWLYFPLGQSVPYATETAPGIIEIATLTEVQAGTNTTLAVTPATASCVFIQDSVLSAKGSLIGASAAGAPEDITLGSEGNVLTVCNACTTGVTWTPLPPNNAIPCALLTAKGQLVGATAAGAPAAISKGADGQYLTACDAYPDGVYWSVPADIPCSLLTAKGQLVAASDLSTPTALPVGTEGQLLAVCSSAPEGLAWITSSAGGGIPCAAFTAAQQLLTSSAAATPCALSVGDNGCILTVSAGAIGWCSNTAIPCALLTAKGQIVAASGTGAPVAIPYPGSNGGSLVVCTACPSGWTTGNFLCCNLYATKGNLVVGRGLGVPGVGDPVVLGVGTDGKVLTACSGTATGMVWANPIFYQVGCGEVILNSNTTCALSLFSTAAGFPLTPGCWMVSAWGTMASNQNSCGDFYLQSALSLGGTFISGTANMGYQFPNTPMRQSWSMNWVVEINASTNVIQLVACKAGGADMCFTRNATAKKLMSL